MNINASLKNQEGKDFDCQIEFHSNSDEDDDPDINIDRITVECFNGTDLDPEVPIYDVEWFDRRVPTKVYFIELEKQAIKAVQDWVADQGNDGEKPE
jgi:hypothetical protein